MDHIVFIAGVLPSDAAPLAEALRTCGIRPADPDPVAALNRRLIAMAGIRPGRIPDPVESDPQSLTPVADWACAIARDQAEAAWDEAFAAMGGGAQGEGARLLADPGLAFTLPLWRDVAAAKGVRVTVYLAHRAAAGLLGEVQRAHRLSLPQAAAHILDTWLAMVAGAPQNARVVSLEALEADPAATLAKLGHTAPSETAPTAPAAAPRTAPRLPEKLIPLPLRYLDKRLAQAHGASLAPDDPFVPAEIRRRAQAKALADETYRLSDVAAPARTAPAGTAARPRPVVVHCHLFKNAGSSVDVILKAHFGARWATREFPVDPHRSNADLTNTFVRAGEDFDVLSTHTGDWWLGHDGDGLTVLPIIFLRHPLLRIRSAYSFEAKQDADTLGARLAKTHDFSGYVRARLERPGDLAFRNFQARRLAAYVDRVTADLKTSAMRALECAPFVGLVEDFDGSVARLEAYLKPHWPDFRARTGRANVTDASAASLADKLARIEADLGGEVHAMLVEANPVDFALYDAACARWSATASTSRSAA